MDSIELSIEIPVTPATLRPALTTPDGFRAWLAIDTTVDAGGRYTFAFGPRVVTFTLDRADDRGIAMTCVGEHDNPDWLGTRLDVRLTAIPDARTRVDLVHAGYPSRNECYQRCIGAWEYFLSSLALYATTGQGRPFDAKVSGPAPAQASAEAVS